MFRQSVAKMLQPSPPNPKWNIPTKCPLYPLCPELCLPSRTDQVWAPKSLKSPHIKDFPSRLWDTRSRLDPEPPLAPPRTDHDERDLKDAPVVSQSFPFFLAPIIPFRPPSTKTKHTTFQPENVTTQCPILPLFSMPLGSTYEIHRRPETQTRKSIIETSLFFPPQS